MKPVIAFSFFFSLASLDFFGGYYSGKHDADHWYAQHWHPDTPTEFVSRSTPPTVIGHDNTLHLLPTPEDVVTVGDGMIYGGREEPNHLAKIQCQAKTEWTEIVAFYEGKSWLITCTTLYGHPQWRVVERRAQ